MTRICSVRRRNVQAFVIGLALAAAPASGAAKSAAVVEEQSIQQLADALAQGRTSSAELVQAYIGRIETIDRGGPTLRSVIAVNPDALKQARALDAERKAGRSRGPLHGIPILIKDNIETRDPMPTTAGSLALKDNVTGRDAPVVARLRTAGAVILGKANLSEWANIRSTHSTSGWSAIGGLSRNPYVLDRNSCGSSGGSGVAAAASLAAATVGTETDGSIVCPASTTGLVGMKPTIGLVSRTHIVPISHSQDTAGPMTRTVRDTAILLSAMAGTDPADPTTKAADRRRVDYVAALDPTSLSGKRIGVMRFAAGFNPRVDALFDAALADLRKAGAEVIEISTLEHREKIGPAEWSMLLTEFKVGLNAYLKSTPAKIPVRSLADVIAFNRRNAATELRWFDQDQFEKAESTKGLDEPSYREASTTAKRLAGPDGIDRLVAQHRLDALVAPTGGPSWRSDLVLGDNFSGGGASRLPAVAGYPHLTVPMGYVEGLPVGLSFIGPAWSEARLLSFGYAFEQLTKHRRRPAYRESITE
jgi:amidase